jgi:4-methylaminobutanoate oxidase (formaldehyde-forming)
MSPDAPVFEDPSSYGYYREEGGGMMVGLFEPTAAAWSVAGIPPTFSFGDIPPDWERMGPFLEKAMSRVPVTLTAGIRTFFCGPESFTPDLQPCVGEAPGIRGYFVAAGMNSVGILSSGGLGRVMAHWITTGRPDVDVTGFNVDRFHHYQAGPAYRAARTTEILGTVYAAHAPGTQLRSARGIKRSPVHEQLVAQGAYFKDVSGWEGADWYAGPGVTPTTDPSWGRGDWWAAWEAEHRAVREGVGLMDMSFMAKLMVEGSGAGAVLDRVSSGAVDGEVGVITYTQWLSDDGRIEADLTVTKLAEGRFLVVASDTAHGHVAAWLGRHIGDAACVVTDVTSGFAQLNVQGPRSRELLTGASSCDFSNGSFPFRAARWVDVGMARVLCVRITYLGELGYELFIPTEMAAHVYETLVAAGAPFGLRHVGLKALASLRMEKGYRDYGHDIDNTDCVLDAGLGFAVALDKPGGFIGRDAVAARKARIAVDGFRQRIVQVRLIDPEPLLFHAEVVYRSGVAVGYVRAASYGWTLGGAVGLAMVSSGEEACTPAWISAGEWEVDIAGRRYAAVASLRPMYDPTNERIKA